MSGGMTAVVYYQQYLWWLSSAFYLAIYIVIAWIFWNKFKGTSAAAFGVASMGLMTIRSLGGIFLGAVIRYAMPPAGMNPTMTNFYPLVGIVTSLVAAGGWVFLILALTSIKAVREGERYAVFEGPPPPPVRD